jgi:dTDP-4-amino-4,6-dideoxygalactose transaminase
MTASSRALPSDQAASGRSLGNEELALLAEVLESGILTSTRGTCVRQLEEGFAALLEVPHVVACSSGSAAMHAAIAAIDPEPGE